MELQYLVIEISFSDAGTFTHPMATVRVRPASIDPATISAASVDLNIKLFDIVPPGADLPAIASAALQAAQAMIEPGAMAAHLQATLDSELQTKRQQDAQLAHALGMPPAGPGSSAG